MITPRTEYAIGLYRADRNILNPSGVVANSESDNFNKKSALKSLTCAIDGNIIIRYMISLENNIAVTNTFVKEKNELMGNEINRTNTATAFSIHVGIRR
jgi:hypothetical protein